MFFILLKMELQKQQKVLNLVYKNNYILFLGKLPIEVKTYSTGDYFGELALIRGEPRAANIIATSDLKVISLDRNSFKRLLGPIEDILKRNSDTYIKYIK